MRIYTYKPMHVLQDAIACNQLRCTHTPAAAHGVLTSTITCEFARSEKETHPLFLSMVANRDQQSEYKCA